jgi:hypothetical protein
MTAVLATAMVLSASLPVCAADGSGGTESSTATITSSTTSTSTSNAYSEILSVDETKVVASNAAITVAGKNVTTTVAGAYLTNKVNGVAVVTPAAELAENLNLAAGQKAYVMVYDFDQKKSNLAMNSINGAAQALGAEFITAINVNLGAMQNGKFVKLADGSVNMVVGLPKTAIDPTKTYSVACVQPGGAVTIYQDLDNDPQTLTFNVKAGLGAYAILAK